MIGNRTYTDAINSLNSLQSNFADLQAVRDTGKSQKNLMNIWEMQEWSRRIGYDSIPKYYDGLNVLHITGTKGKGSTGAFCQSILEQYAKNETMPLKIGMYTSPHLKSVRERIRINGNPISEELFTKYFFQVWDRMDATSSDESKFPHMTLGKKPGYFKFLTVLSFHVFVQEKCNTCIYEVGIGGEYDSTNVIENPTTCGVSLLGIDHVFVLGDTIEKIAWNKSGIFKKNAPAFTISGQPTQGLQVLKERAVERETTLTVVPNFSQLKNVQLGIHGDFQITNASLAAGMCAAHLNKIGHPEAPKLPASTAWDNFTLPEKFVQGLVHCKWEGRCQTVQSPQHANLRWYLDGAHTKDSIEACSSWFAQVITAKANAEKDYKVLLFNQQTRDASALINVLHNVITIQNKIKFDKIIFSTNVTWGSGKYDADLVSMNVSKQSVDALEVQKNLKESWEKLESNADIEIFHSIEDAYKTVSNIAAGFQNQNRAVDVLCTGSLHLVGGLMVVFDGH